MRAVLSDKKLTEDDIIYGSLEIFASIDDDKYTISEIQWFLNSLTLRDDKITFEMFSTFYVDQGNSTFVSWVYTSSWKKTRWIVLIQLKLSS